MSERSFAELDELQGELLPARTTMVLGLFDALGLTNGGGDDQAALAGGGAEDGGDASASSGGGGGGGGAAAVNESG